MRNYRIAVLFASCCAGAVAVPAIAQSTLSDASTDHANSNIDPQENGGLGEIVVTARKRNERAQETPISLTAATGEMLEDRAITQFIELQQQTPSLQIMPAALGVTSTVLSMRGLVLADTRLNIDPTIGIYQDGVYLPRAVGVNAAELLDVERVEVLAGPQGTLFGKNTTGGALNIFTNSPSDILEGEVKGRYGSYQEYALSTVLNIPLAQSLAARFVGSVSGVGGFGTNRFDDSPTDKVDNRYIRGSIRWEPSDELTVTLRGDYSLTDSTQAARTGVYGLAAPTLPGAGLGAPLSTVQAALQFNGIPDVAAWLALPASTKNSLFLAADTLLRSYSTGNLSDGNYDQSATEKMKVWGYSATIEYQVSNKVGVKSVTAIREFDRDSSADIDGTPAAILQYPVLDARDRQFSEELQISGNFLNDRLKSIAGAYFSSEKGTEFIQQVALPNIATATPVTFQDSAIQNKSFGVFTQHTFAMTDRLGLTAGLRWTRDERALTSFNRNSVNCLALGVTIASIEGAENCKRPMEVKYSRVNYTLGAEYKATDDLFFYLTTRRGYRAGGLQQTTGGTTPAIANVALQPFGPETVTDIEGGIKSQLFERRLRVNLAVYHSKVDGAIRNVAVPVPGTTSAASAVRNAASVLVDGVEFDVVALPFPQLELGVNGSYTDARFKEYVLANGTDLSNLPVLFAPKWKLGTSAAYTADLTFGEWRTSINYAYSGEQLTSEPTAISPAHSIVNARTSLKWDEPQIELAFNVKNITNERYPVYPLDLVSAFGLLATGQYNRPRTFSVEIAKRF